MQMRVGMVNACVYERSILTKEDGRSDSLDVAEEECDDAMIRQFMSNASWGEFHYLVVDTLQSFEDCNDPHWIPTWVKMYFLVYVSTGNIASALQRFEPHNIPVCLDGRC